MNPVDLLLRAEAAESGKARSRRELRHVHVEKAPLAIIALQMAGEPHALWAALVGTTPDPAQARLIIAPEPRNYDIEFGALAEIGTVVCETVDRFAKGPREQVIRKNKPPRWRFKNAPQLLVASAAGAAHLARLARRMRPAGFGGKKVVPPVVNAAGAHLGFFAEAIDEPGSNLMLVAAKELSRHFVTGQSDLENAHLGTQLAWHDPKLLADIVPEVVKGIDIKKLRGPAAAALVEKQPMGVLTDPDTDSTELVDLVTTFNRRREKRTDAATVSALAAELGFAEHLRPILLPIWRAAWAAHQILLKMSPAPSVAERWASDCDAFTYHVEYVNKGGRFASVPSIRRAARQLGIREQALSEVTSAEVLEDSLAMAAALAQGEAIRGKVIDVDGSHYEMGAKRRTLRPLVTLEIDVECPFPVGAELYWSERPGLVTEIHTAPTSVGAKTRITLKVTAGMKGELPTKGSHATFSIYSRHWVPDAPMPAQTPWTHEPAADAPTHDSLELDDGPPLDELIGLVTVEETV
jgi:hypothetical protein